MNKTTNVIIRLKVIPWMNITIKLLNPSRQILDVSHLIHDFPGSLFWKIAYYNNLHRSNQSFNQIPTCRVQCTWHMEGGGGSEE